MPEQIYSEFQWDEEVIHNQALGRFVLIRQLNSFYHRCLTFGLRTTVNSTLVMIFGSAPILSDDLLRSYFYLRTGIEIGGPSAEFDARGIVPVYKIVSAIDLVDFSHENLWRDGPPSPLTRTRDKSIFRNYFVVDATELDDLCSNCYDFVLASMVLEHIANPIKAIKRWKDVLKKNGILVMIVPDHRLTADHLREVTMLSHFWQDYRNNRSEADLTHVEEVLQLYDLEIEPMVKDSKEFESMLRDNFKFRFMHHHVFSAETMRELLVSLGFKELVLTKSPPFHLVGVYVKC